MDEAVIELKEWAARELPDERRDDRFLRRFLHGCKMRRDVAREKIRNFYKLRDKTPQWFTGRDPQASNLATLIKMGVFLPLLDKDEEGRTIVVVRATINNPRTHSMMDVFKVGMMVLDAVLEEDESIAEHGVKVIIDLDQVSMFHALQMTPQLLHKAVHSWQDCYPVRIRSIHFVNCPVHVNVVLSVLKRFMRDKLRRRVYTHGQDLTAVHEDISPSLLPIEYQGSKGTIKDTVRHWHSFTNSRRDWFLSQG